MPVQWGALIWSLSDLLEAPAPLAEHEVQNAMMELFQKLHLEPVHADSENWESTHKARVWKHAADNRDTAEWIYGHIKALVRRHPSALDLWLRLAPRAFFPPKERAELVLDALALNPSSRTKLRLQRELVPLLKTLVQEPLPPRSCVADKRFPLLPVGERSVLSISQTEALERILKLGRAYFSGLGNSLPIRPRFSTFLAAPTGSGKTFVASRAAELLKAKLFVVSAGEWIPDATREASSYTQYNLLAAIRTSERVVCFIDEIDKFALGDQASAWTRFCAAEIWATLDRRLPIDSFCKRNNCEEIAETILRRVNEGLYFIAAGTFQSLFDRIGAQKCGFSIDSQDQHDDAEIHQSILREGIFPAELLSRFSEEPIVLRYPTHDETTDLLNRSGLNALAAKAGLPAIDPNEVEWEGVGFRALEGLASRLICRIAERDRTAQLENRATL
jgi:hypothetical protein